MDLKTLLGSAGTSPCQRTALLAMLNLGIVESLVNGLVSASDVPRLFYHAENCLFVRKLLRDKTADEMMSRGVQLSDLIEALSPDEAQRKFQRELTTIRRLCLKLLEKKPLVA